VIFPAHRHHLLSPTPPRPHPFKKRFLFYIFHKATKSALSNFLLVREELRELKARDEAVKERGETGTRQEEELEQMKRTIQQLQADLQSAEQSSAQVSQSCSR